MTAATGAGTSGGPVVADCGALDDDNGDEGDGASEDDAMEEEEGEEGWGGKLEGNCDSQRGRGVDCSLSKGMTFRDR